MTWKELEEMADLDEHAWAFERLGQWISENEGVIVLTSMALTVSALGKSEVVVVPWIEMGLPAALAKAFEAVERMMEEPHG